VIGVQQAPLVHFSPVPHVPQETVRPQALLTLPQVIVPQVGGIQAVHVPAVHVFIPVQPPHFTCPLPHALGIVPHFDPVPPSSPVHSGGGAVHTPPVQSWPIGQVHCFVLPQPLLTVPQRFTPGAGEHVSVPQVPPPPSLGGGWVTQALFTQVSPVGHPPQLIATPHESTPISPHLPAHEGVWHDCDPPLVTHDSPFAHGMPHVSVLPVQSV
jgi:hypothetical protein